MIGKLIKEWDMMSSKGLIIGHAPAYYPEGFDIDPSSTPTRFRLAFIKDHPASDSYRLVKRDVFVIDRLGHDSIGEPRWETIFRLVKRDKDWDGKLNEHGMVDSGDLVALLIGCIKGFVDDGTLF